MPRTSNKPEEIMNFIKEDDSTTVEIELRDLKSILDDIVIGDYAEFHTEEIAGGYAVAIDKFMSDRVLSKIAEFNQKAFLNSSAKKPYKPIEISEEGLELIEFLSLDCTAAGGEWHSDSEIKIDKMTQTQRIDPCDAVIDAWKLYFMNKNDLKTDGHSALEAWLDVAGADDGDDND